MVKMAKEWILNMATNRWGPNQKKNVGPVSQWIRECSPKSLEEWENFYYQKLAKMLENKGINLEPQEYLTELGRKLYVKISEVLKAEIEEVGEEDCIQYIRNLVINRTYEGYKTEINTIYGQLQKILGVKVEPAPDEWDRLYNIDFFIEINGSRRLKCINGKKFIERRMKNLRGRKEARYSSFSPLRRIKRRIFTTKK